MIIEASVETAQPPRRISAIMPVYNGARFAPQSLPPLLDMSRRGEVMEVIVVDDGSSDDSAGIATKLGARVLSTGGRTGVGAARNLAVDAAGGDVVWFVDADVVVHDNAAKIIARGFEDPAVVAVFGSYDDTPPARNFLSQYKNLVHHYYHQRAKSEASTFWAGCGAVRKSAFTTVGGFDTKRYLLPSIEDIELGYRLRAAGGRIRLLKDLHGTHLKIWRFVGLIHTEMFSRAIPWTRLMLKQGKLTGDLNISLGERLKAVVAVGLLLGVIATAIGWVSPWALASILLVTGFANWRLVKLFFQRNGLLFSLAGLLFHQFYYLYSSTAFAYAWVIHQIRRSAD